MSSHRPQICRLTDREIQLHVPARSAASLSVNYKYIKALVEVFSDDEKKRLKDLVIEDDKKRWQRIGKAMGKSEVSCQKMAKELNLVLK